MRVLSMAALLTTVTALTSACGGSVFTGASPGGDSGAGDGSARDSAPGPFDGGGPDGFGDDSSAPWSPVCPATAPTAGTACSMENLQCEYGSAWWSVACDQVMQCESGRWTTFQPSFEPCSAEPGPNATDCPPTFADVPQGSVCATTGLSCVYAQGQCACQVPLEGPVEIDGGTGYWGCVPEPGCPYPRARLGTACTSAQSNCTYEECSYAQACDNGVWQAEEEACAGAVGGGPGQ